jgi:hypothetical protein
LDEAGEILLEQKVATTPEAMKQIFEKIPRGLIAMETGTHSPWVSRLLTELGYKVIVAHAQKVQLITKSNRKDDRHDARTLARLARIDLARKKEKGAKKEGKRKKGKKRDGIQTAELDRRDQVTATKSWPNFPSSEGSEVDYQVAAPTESSTPNLHRANHRSTKSADGRVATEAAWLHGKQFGKRRKQKTRETK